MSARGVDREGPVRAELVAVGLNRVDAAVYGDEATLEGCLNDAEAMVRLCRDRGIAPAGVLLDGGATRAGLASVLGGMASRLGPGDLGVFAYAGHGSQVEDGSGGDEAVADGLDETLVLYDGMLRDDELNGLLAGFAPGVRLLVLLDCCHSGSGTRVFARGRTGPAGERVRALPRRFAATAETRQEASGLVEAPRTAVRADVVTWSACRDEETAGDSGRFGGRVHGTFTAALLDAWAGGTFAGSLVSLHGAVRHRIRGRQNPVLSNEGPTSYRLLRQRPFLP